MLVSDEAPNAVLAFQVTLNRAAAGTVTVGYATADGTATAGADYTAASGTLTFDPGETAKTANVPVLDDVHDDDEETLTLTLSNATGARIRDAEATGTIENSDPIPQAWLARFGAHGLGPGAGCDRGTSAGLAHGRGVGPAGRADPRLDGGSRRKAGYGCRGGEGKPGAPGRIVGLAAPRDRGSRAGRDTVADPDGARGADGIVLRAGREDGQRRVGRGLGAGWRSRASPAARPGSASTAT